MPFQARKGLPALLWGDGIQPSRFNFACPLTLPAFLQNGSLTLLGRKSFKLHSHIGTRSLIDS